MKIILFSFIQIFTFCKKIVSDSPIQITSASLIRPNKEDMLSKFADLRTREFMKLAAKASSKRPRLKRTSTSNQDSNEESAVNTFINVNPVLKSGTEALEDLRKRFKKWYKSKPRIEVKEIGMLKSQPNLPIFLELMKDPKAANPKSAHDKDSRLVVYTDEHPTREVAKVLYKWLGNVFFDEAFEAFKAFRAVSPNTTAAYLVAMEEDEQKSKRRIIHKTNNVTILHLERALRSFGWKFSSDDYDEVAVYLMEKFDYDNSGELSFSEFVYFLFKTSSQFFYSLNCKYCLQEAREEIMHFFDFADKDGNNLVTPEELLESLNSLVDVDLKYDYIFYFYSKAERCEYRIELTVEEMSIAFFQALWEMGLQENKVKEIETLLEDPNAKFESGKCPIKPKKRTPIKPCKDSKDSKDSKVESKQNKNAGVKSSKLNAEEDVKDIPEDPECPDGDCGKSKEYIRGIPIEKFDISKLKTQEKTQIEGDNGEDIKGKNEKKKGNEKENEEKSTNNR